MHSASAMAATTDELAVAYLHHLETAHDSETNEIVMQEHAPKSFLPLCNLAIVRTSAGI